VSVNVKDKTVCVTGTIPGLSRIQANAKLQEAGAHTVGSVTKNTHLLITGAGVGAVKVAKAEKLGVIVVPWEDVAWDGNGDDVVSAAAPPPKTLAHRQVQPMLAQGGELADTASGEWAFEIKWDGVRAVAHIEDHAVGIQSRSAKTDLAKRFPTIAAALTGFVDCVLDGEIVVLESEDSGGSFQMLANHANSGSARFVVFDVIECQGHDLRMMPFRERRDLLETLIQSNDVIALSPVSCATRGWRGSSRNGSTPPTVRGIVARPG
jgi:ATP-dependent DNA ligase